MSNTINSQREYDENRLGEVASPSEAAVAVADTGTWKTYLAMKDLAVRGECEAGTWDDAVKLCRAAGAFLDRKFQPFFRGEQTWIIRIA